VNAPERGVGAHAVVDDSLEVSRPEGERFEPPADLPIYVSPAGDPRGDIVRTRIAPAKASANAAGLRPAYVTNYPSPGL
jgi:hypothetical protein